VFTAPDLQSTIGVVCDNGIASLSGEKNASIATKVFRDTTVKIRPKGD